MDIHDHLVIREAELIAQEMIEKALIEKGFNPREINRRLIEAKALELLANTPDLFQRAYDKLRRN